MNISTTGPRLPVKSKHWINLLNLQQTKRYASPYQMIIDKPMDGNGDTKKSPEYRMVDEEDLKTLHNVNDVEPNLL